MVRSAPPNILLVIADDHQAAAIGALGHPVVRTPTLDTLVRDGTTFTRAGIMGSLMPAVCAPSRACLLTGHTVMRADAAPHLVASPEFQITLPADASTLPEWLRNVGYETFFAGKWHNDEAALLRSFDQGRAIFVGGMCDHRAVPVRDLEEIRRGESPRVARGFSSEIFCGEAEGFVRDRSRTRPFFACVALTSPHDPRTPPDEFRALYDPKRIPLPASFQLQHPFDNGELVVRDEQLAASPRQPEEVRRHLAEYYAMISHHDACLGRLFGALRETGDEENTIVVYVSDHGLALGGHGLMGKQNLYEHSRRVPLILRGPGLPRGRQCAALAYSLDVYATLCELVGIKPPEGIESRSLVPALTPGAPPIREELGALYMDCQRMMMDGRWKLIVYKVNGSVRIQLFDLETDPEEVADLADRPESRPIIARLGSRLDAWQRDVGDQWMHLSGSSCGQPVMPPR